MATIDEILRHYTPPQPVPEFHYPEPKPAPTGTAYYSLGVPGTVFKFDLPLTPVIQQQVDLKQLHRVNEDGTPYTEKD